MPAHCARSVAHVTVQMLAFMIAEQGDGLVWFYGRDWASPDDRGENLWVTA